MKRKKHGRRILSCVLAASMAVPAVSVPVTAYGASGLVRDAYGVSGKRSQDGALEEVGGLELKGAYLDTDSERGNVLTVTGPCKYPQWSRPVWKKVIYPAGGYQDDRHRG